MTAESDPDTAETLLLAGRYRRESLIGEGGMGRVWRGCDELLDRDVAIKELIFPPGMGHAERSELRKRMQREARTAARISHPSLVAIYDVVEADGRPWIIMELVQAQSLSTILNERGPLPTREVADYGRQLAHALTVAHAEGVVHRDVKPGNVLITDRGRVVVTDFGIAVHHSDSTLTRTGVLVGSPAYLAPEVARGQSATSASDLWSLGITLYAALEGRSPFHREAGPLATLTAIISEEAPPPPDSADLRFVLEGLLHKDPQRRMTGAETNQALRSITDEAGSTESVVARLRRSLGGVSPRSRYLAVAAATAGVAAATIAMLVARVDGTTQEEDSSNDAAVAGNQAATSESQDDPGEVDQGPPQGMEMHSDETGFSLHVPETWDVEPQGENMVYFHNPAGGHLLVDQTTTPGDDALTDWQNLEGQISGNFTDYEQVRLEHIDHPAMEPYHTAADWEFTHSNSEHGDMRAINRGFHTDEYGYALFLNMPETEWEDGGWELMEEFTESFEPAG